MITKHVVAVFVVSEDYILLSQRLTKSYIGQWQLPGGSFEDEESWQEAAIRETIEETGLLIDPKVDLGIIPFQSESDPQKTNILHFVFATVVGSTGSPTDAETEKNTPWQWFPINELPSPLISRIPAGINLLKQYLGADR